MLGAVPTAQLSNWWGQPTPPPPVGQSVINSTVNYAFQQYSTSSVSYVGPDSSSRPVFFFAYANASNQLRAIMFRIEDNGAVILGAEQSAGSQSCYHSVQAMSEYEGANGFGVGSGNYVYLAYTNNPVTTGYVQAASVNQDALTCTFGTALTLTGTPDFDGAVVAYVGNSRCVAGCRTGGGMSMIMYTRSGTTLTATIFQSVDQGFRIDPAELGFQSGASFPGAPGTQYRSGFFDTGNGASVTVYGASQFDGFGLTTTNTSITNSNQNFGCNLNTTEKLLGGYYYSATQTLNVAAVSITWSAAFLTPPSLSIGTSQTISYTPDTGTAWFPVSGFAIDTAYILYNNSATGLAYIPITVSGTTVSVGTSVPIFNNITNINYGLIGSSAAISTKTYLAGVQPRTSGAPYIYGVRLS